MRALLQRVSKASVVVAGEEIARIGPGLLVFIGVLPGDTPADAEKLALKTVRLRVFSDPADAEGRAGMTASVADIGGQVLVVSQFTLAADTRRGLRPSFSGAAPPAVAEPLYRSFVTALEAELAQDVEQGRFGADMQVSLVNDGPVTLLLES
ncbi:MAG: D-aminoacyl-tRNA deacylase [Pseudomonadota bacterium]